MVAPVVVARPVDGLHEYVLAPVADNVVADPEQIVVAPPPADTDGSVFTVIVLVAVVLLALE